MKEAPSLPRVRILEGPDEAIEAAVHEWSESVSGGTVESPRNVLLAGGSTPERLYRALARSGAARPERFETLECFFGDERCVPPDHPDSNFGRVRRTLLEPLGPVAPKVHRIRGEDPDPAHAARDYETLLRRRFDIRAPEVPSFDLALLGLGSDGHTASLFTGAPIPEPERLVVAVQHPAGDRRITVTYALLNAARRILFFVLGDEKADAVARSLRPGAGADPPPAALVRPRSGEVVWILDRAAARRLSA